MVAEQGGCNCLARCNQAVERFLEKIFRAIGKFVGHRPWTTIILSIIVVLICGCGYMVNWTEESRVDELWIPRNARAVGEQEWVIDVFGYDLRFGEILLKPDGNGNALEDKYVQQYYTAYYLMVNTTAKATEYTDIFNETYSWDGYDSTTSVCFKPDYVSCSMTHILDIIGYDYNTIMSMTTDDILDAINNYTDTDSYSSMFGGIEYDDNGDIISASILRGSYIIEADVIDVDAEYIDPSREAWELAADINMNAYNYEDATVIPYFSATFSAEFSSAITGDLALFGIGYSLLIFYAALALGKRDYVHSMYGIAGAAITTVLLAMGGSYGLAGYFGIIYTPLAGSLPFLILGLGVDDAFIIVGEFQQICKEHPFLDIPSKMEKTMKHAGVSILITSLTDVTAFFIGSSTVLPALEAYCLFAAFGVIFVFLLNITFFAACVVIDAKRAQLNRPDCCCCWKLKIHHPMFPEIESSIKTHIINSSQHDLVTNTATPVPDPNNNENNENNENNPNNINNNNIDLPPHINEGNRNRIGRLSYCGCIHLIPEELTRKMFRNLGYFLMNIYVKIIIILLTFGLLGSSIYFATKLEQDFNIEWFLPDDSYLQEYYDWKEDYFASGDSISFYAKDIDYYDFKDELFETRDLFLTANYLVNNTYTDWHSEFWDYIDTYNIDINETNYYNQLNIYLNSFGISYSAYVEWNDQNDPTQGIKGSYMTGEYQVWATTNAAKQVNAMNDIRDDVSKIADDDQIFPFTFSMLFWEQYAVIAEEMWRNIGLAVGVVFIISIILIPNIVASLLVLTTVTFTIIDVLGCMYLWGLTIDGVTVCYTVIAIGLAVDYSAHVGEAYMLSKAKTKEDRVIDSLYRIGASVFNGAFSTFLAVVAMGFAETYIFRVFFRQFFLVTTIGSIHGLVVLPILLSWFGPEDRMETHDEDSIDETKKSSKNTSTKPEITHENEEVEMNKNTSPSPLPTADEGNVQLDSKQETYAD